MMNDGDTPDNTSPTMEKKLIDICRLTSPYADPRKKEPPDKAQLRLNLKGHIAMLKCARTRAPANSNSEKCDFEGQNWERGSDGQWKIGKEEEKDDTFVSERMNAVADEYRDYALHHDVQLTIRSFEARDPSTTPTTTPSDAAYTIQTDTGANVNATPFLDLLVDVVHIEPSTINTAKKEEVNMLATGIGKLPVTAQGRTYMVNCYFIPEASNTILSPTAIGLQFHEEFYAFYHKSNLDNRTGAVVMQARDGYHTWSLPIHGHNGLWWHYDDQIYNEMEPPTTPQPATIHINRLSDAAKFELWHQRLGHPGQYVTNNIHKTADGVPNLRANAFYKCHTCMHNKTTKRATHVHNEFGSASATNSEPQQSHTDAEADLESFLDEWHLPDAKPGQHFHIDIGFVRGSDWVEKNDEGKIITSIDGKRSYCLIVDRATRYIWVYTSATKDPPIEPVRLVLNKFKSDDKHKTIRTDQDKSLGRSEAFKLMVEDEGFVMELTGSDNSRQNSPAERPHRDLGNMMRCMVDSADIGHEYWTFAINYSSYIKNRVPHSALKGMSPYQCLTGTKPNLAHLKVFGSIVYAKNPGKRPMKLDHHTSRGRFLGFSATSGNCYYEDEKTKKIKLATHVYFDEAHMTTSAKRRPPAAEALQRLGYSVRESWIDLELKKGIEADIKNNMLVEQLSATAIVPTRGTDESIGYDLYCDREECTIYPGEIELISTGLAIRAPPGSYLRVAPRSGLTVKRKMTTLAGVVDPDFTGCITVQNIGTEPQNFKRGDRIAQLIVERANTPTIELVDKLPGTTRGAAAFGSTDKDYTNVIRGLHLEMDVPPSFHLSDNMFENYTTRTINVTDVHKTLGLELEMCKNHTLPKLKQCAKSTPAGRLPRWRSELRNAYVMKLDNTHVKSVGDIEKYIAQLRENKATEVTITFATVGKQSIHPQKGTPQVYIDQLNIIAQHLWDLTHDPTWSDTAQQHITMVESFLEDEQFNAFIKEPKAKRLFIAALRKKTLKQQRKLTRRILKNQEDWNDWKQSEYKQLDQYYNQDTFGPPTWPTRNTNILSLLWTYMIKDDGTKKARCVCNGSKKLRGSVTLAETYAGSLEQTASRIFWAATAIYNFVTIGADASNAFAEAPAPKAPLYVHVDEPFREWYKERFGKDIERGKVMRVKKALQGHPESPRLWAELIDNVIRELNLKPCTHEPNLYFTRDYNGTGKKVLFLRQVDDFAIACETNELAEQVIEDVDSKMSIKVKKLGRITRYNGVDITQSRHYVKISNATYIDKILVNHPWLTETAYPTTSYPLPMKSESTYQRSLETATSLEPSQLERLEDKLGFKYRQAIGELLFGLVTCRPDISYPTVKLSQYSMAPGNVHFEAVKAIFAFLRDTKHDGIYYWRIKPRPDLPIEPLPECRRDENYNHASITELEQYDDTTLVAAKDSDYAGDVSHRKSVTGVVIKLAGGAVLFKTQFQKSPALSSTEAEFSAAATAGKHILYLRTILDEIGIPQHAATVLFEDNQGSLLMAKAQKPTKRTRHVSVQDFAIQDWVKRDLIAIQRITTADNYSDAMTKALGRTLFYRHNDYIMGRVIPEFARPAVTPVLRVVNHTCIDFDNDYVVHASDHLHGISYHSRDHGRV